ncbi:NAD(P)H-dependent flavin oxidoreductase [Xanthobacter sp. TB0136]|uniref:NAD(P)H-dependent flavin oxidoreductase n=1 Tax=Xanthobacter sp. TB0136 TaxID=3459177 RepID=UPI0040392437
MSHLMERLHVNVPIIQAPMAGTSSPQLAAAVCAAGALGSIALGAGDAEAGRIAIRETRMATTRLFNVNLFCHEPAVRDEARERAWLDALSPSFQAFDATPPDSLREIYRSFVNDDAMADMLAEERPAIVSFHFGLPPAARIARLKADGAVLFASVTNLEEARAAAAAGVDALVAQGIEAGGHRGVFDPQARDERLSTFTLVSLLVKELDLPVIAAGGIMNGAGIAACLDLGAIAVQLGTAFIACPESLADQAHRAALLGPGSAHTVLTDAISGRPARCIANDFTALGQELARNGHRPAGYPMAYDAGKALNAAARAAGNMRYGAQWAGQGAPLARALPAAELVDVLMRECEAARAARNPDKG